MSSEGWIDPTRAALDLFKALPRDEPVWMLNLVRFLDDAAYPRDHALHRHGLTGAAAYQRYSEASDAVFRRVGGSVSWRADMHMMLIGPAEESWDRIFIAHYPSAAAFLTMVTDAEYREAVKHRQAALRDSRLIRCQTRPGGGGFG